MPGRGRIGYRKEWSRLGGIGREGRTGRLWPAWLATAGFAVVLGLAYSLTGIASSQERRTYPPYPDIWGYEFPSNSLSRRYIGLTLYDQPNGDILVSYVMGLRGPEEHFVFHGVGFFSGRKARYSRDEYSALERTYRRIAPPTQARFSDGSVLTPWSACVGNCCPAYSRFLRRIDSKGRDVLRKSIFLVSDKPTKVGVGRYCEHNWGLNRDEIETRIGKLDPVLARLEDDTVLLADSSGTIVIRLTPDLESKSTLYGRQIVLIDRHVVDELHVNPATGQLRNDQQVADAIEAYIAAHQGRR